MTMQTPAFAMIGECPGWCTLNHDEILGEPGDHEAQIVTFTNGHVALVSGAKEGVEVSLSIAGENVHRIPVAEATECLTEIARAALTAAYRLGVIDAAEESTALSGRVSYSLDFAPELLSLGDAAMLLNRAATREHMPEVADLLDQGEPGAAAEAFLENLDKRDNA